VGCHPSLVFLLLDCGRADRFGAWGHVHPTTPQLDALAAAGVRFARHFANAHATRESMPQLMSGRYHHATILRPLAPWATPHEYPFRRREPGVVLLPELLRDAGYHVLGVSTHPWVVRESLFGAAFHDLEFLAVEPARGHETASAVIDRAIARWRERPRDAPTFLYLHLMDLHLPRWLPPGGCRFLPSALDWQARFADGSAPRFGERVRYWDQRDASDFTAEDRLVFAAFYDTALAALDAEIGRLLTVLREDDPELRRTVVAVTADHGEYLGEEGLISHPPALHDCGQQVPLVLAGGAIEPGQVRTGFSENVDVVPTVAHVLGVARPGLVWDGEPLLDGAGRLRPIDRDAVCYTWLAYEGIRTADLLLERLRERSPAALARGRRERLWRLVGTERQELSPEAPEWAAVPELAAALDRRLGPGRVRFAGSLAARPTRSFSIPAPAWEIVGAPPITAVRLGPQTRRRELRARGWLYARESFVVLRRGHAAPLVVRVPAPPGTYEVALEVVRVPRTPWLPGRTRELRWVRLGFHPMTPEPGSSLGVHTAEDGALEVTIPPELAVRRRIVALRLTPPQAEDHVAPAEDDREEERVYRERLRTLGYVE
jgi:arylsulfatase A-like enzyme